MPPLSRDSTLIPGADAVGTTEGNTAKRAFASAALARRGQRPWQVRTLLAREPGEEYEQNLEANLKDLHARLFRGSYRALPSRRVYISKAAGRQRPLGDRGTGR